MGIQVSSHPYDLIFLSHSVHFFKDLIYNEFWYDIETIIPISFQYKHI